MTYFKNILIILNANIGDFVCATSAISLVKKSCPHVKVTVLLSETVKSLAENIPFIDEIITHNFISSGRKAGLLRLLQIKWYLLNSGKIKQSFFDACVFMDSSGFLSLAMKKLKIPKRFGPSTYWCGYNVKNPDTKNYTDIVNMPPDSDHTHITYRYQTIIRSFIKTYNMSVPILPAADVHAEKKVKHLLNKKKKNSIVLSLQGEKNKNNSKAYPQNFSLELIEILNSRLEADFYIIGSKDCYKKAASISDKLKFVNNLCGATNLIELMSVFKQTDILITVDTGTMHIAAACGSRIVALFGSAFPEYSMPVTYKSVILSAGLKCASCNYKATLLNIACRCAAEPDCLKAIKPDLIAGKTIDLLNKEFL